MEDWYKDQDLFSNERFIRIKIWMLPQEQLNKTCGMN